jgi:hypothetical protein
MTQETPLAGNAPNLPPGTLDRLAQFVEWTGVPAPSRLLDEDGAPTMELAAFSMHQGLSLDWLFRGDVRAIVTRLHKLTCNHILNRGYEDDKDDDRLTVEAEVVALLLRCDPEQRRIIKEAALDRLSGKLFGDVLWRMVADLDSYRKLRGHPATKGQA